MLIRGGRVVDPATGLDARRDLRTVGDRIVELGEHLEPHGDEELVDATGCYVAPGFLDMHVHLREPGYEHKETIATGTAAAVRGGFTAVAAMPNTAPALDTAQRIADMLERARRDAACRVYPIGAITLGRAGAEPTDVGALARAGCVGFSDDGNTVMNARVLRDAVRAAHGTHGVFISHAEDEDLKGDAVMHEGRVSRALGLPGSPAVAEDVIVARDLLIAAECARPWHIAHLSTRGALDAVRTARARGFAATCEVTPHHLVFTDEAVVEKGAAAKVNPPLRESDDAAVLREAVRNGEIDAFATDHAPHTLEEKSADLRTAAVGFTGLEVAVGAYALAVPDLPVLRFVALLSTNPCGILHVPGGTLAPGAVADITIFADRPWRVEPERFASKGKVTPFAGMTLPRAIVRTVVGGVTAYTGTERF